MAAALSLAVLGVLTLAGVFSSNPKHPAQRPTITTTTATAATATTTTPTTAPVAQPLPAPSTTLKPGDTGAQVVILQRALKSLGYSTGKLDGHYGPRTSLAVARFQQATQITADGILGPATLTALTNALRGP
jgi:peptidoglycan hydrolase-like protein with peptidoglycan-binding domain